MRRIALMVLLLAGCGGSDGSGNVNPDGSYDPDGGYPRAALSGDNAETPSSADALPSGQSLRRAGVRPAAGTRFRPQHQ
jgi:hypothetical protein